MDDVGSRRFGVEACRSLGPRVSLVCPDVAVFTHRIRTRLAGGSDELAERESTVFRRCPGGGWLAVHEHLSPDPVEDMA